MTWPAGFGTQLRLDGRARDLRTPEHGDPTVLAQDEFSIGVDQNRCLDDVWVSPARPGIDGLVGARGGGQLRSAVRDVIPDEVEAGSPLCLLLDDVAGCTLIAGFAWSRWRDWKDMVAPEATDDNQDVPQPKRRPMVGTCAGFRPGSKALGADGSSDPDMRHNLAVAPALADPGDPMGWHDLDPHPPVAMRRARRIDVWREKGSIAVDAMFRDSCWQPDGLEVAVHEYSIAATIDAQTGQVAALQATPRVLPFAECPAAAPNASWMVGSNARDLRSEVLVRLRSTDCCTHLNDALRSLAEVPVLAHALSRG
jgi:hypothetical protein